MIIRDIYASISAIATFLGVLQNFFRAVLVTIASSPAVHLVLGSAAEFQQLQPVVFHKIKNPGNALSSAQILSPQCSQVTVSLR